MQKDYKILPDCVRTKDQAERYWHTIPALQALPVNSIVATPPSGSVISVNCESGLEVKGYAVPQGDDGPVVKVEVSVDGERVWREAEILGQEEQGEMRWAWSLWRVGLRAEVVRGFTEKTSIWSRATDRGGNVQTGVKNWNYRGVAYNGFGEAKGFRIVRVGEGGEGGKTGA